MEDHMISSDHGCTSFVTGISQPVWKLKYNECINLSFVSKEMQSVSFSHAKFENAPLCEAQPISCKSHKTTGLLENNNSWKQCKDLTDSGFGMWLTTTDCPQILAIANFHL